MKDSITYRTRERKTVTWTKAAGYSHDFGRAACDGCGWTAGHVEPAAAQSHANDCTAY